MSAPLRTQGQWITDENGWLPIASAPRDGSDVLGYGPHETKGYYIGDIHFYNGAWTIEWMHGYGSPTHWQSLPKPPVQAALNTPAVRGGAK